MNPSTWCYAQLARPPLQKHPWIWACHVRGGPLRTCHGSRIITRMKGELVRLSRSLLLPLVFGLATTESTALPPAGDTPLQRALAVIENDHAGLCPVSRSQEKPNK